MKSGPFGATLGSFLFAHLKGGHLLATPGGHFDVREQDRYVQPRNWSNIRALIVLGNAAIRLLFTMATLAEYEGASDSYKYTKKELFLDEA